MMSLGDAGTAGTEPVAVPGTQDLDSDVQINDLSPDWRDTGIPESAACSRTASGPLYTASCQGHGLASEHRRVLI